MGRQVICTNGYLLGFFPSFLVSNTTKLILSVGKILFFSPETVSFMIYEKGFLSTYIVWHFLGASLVP